MLKFVKKKNDPELLMPLLLAARRDVTKLPITGMLCLVSCNATFLLLPFNFSRINAKTMPWLS